VSPNLRRDNTGITIRLGAHDLGKPAGPGEEEVKVDEVVFHKDFDEVTMNNDIAVMHLSRPVNFTDNILPICLPKRDQFFPHGTRAIVSGWGALKGKSFWQLRLVVLG